MYCCDSILAGIKPIAATDTTQVSVHTSQLQNNTSWMCTKQWRAEHISRQMTPPRACFSMGRYMWSLTYCIRWHQNMRVSLLIPDVLSDVNRPQGRLFLLGIPPTIRHLSLPLKSPSLTHTTPDLSYNTQHWRPDLISSSGSSKPIPICQVFRISLRIVTIRTFFNIFLISETGSRCQKDQKGQKSKVQFVFISSDFVCWYSIFNLHLTNRNHIFSLAVEHN